MAYSFDDAGAADRHTTQYFEMFCNRGIYHEGWTAVTRHSIPWVATEPPAVRRRRLGALRTGRLDAGPRPRRRAAREAARAAAPLPDRGHASTTCCRSTTAASSASTPTSPVGRSWSGHLAAALRRHGPASENSVIANKNKSYAITARDGRAAGGRRRRDHRPGRRLRRLRASTRRTGSRRTATTSSACSSSRSTATTAIPRGRAPGADGVRLRRRRSRQGRRRHALSRRRPGRRGPRRRNGADDLLRGRDDRHRLATARRR